MKKMILTLGCLFAATSFANADDAMVLVRGKVLSSRSFPTAHGELTVVKLDLETCGEDACSGQVKIALPAGHKLVQKNGHTVIVLSETALSRLEEFKKGGSMESVAMVAEAPVGGSTWAQR